MVLIFFAVRISQAQEPVENVDTSFLDAPAASVAQTPASKATEAVKVEQKSASDLPQVKKFQDPRGSNEQVQKMDQVLKQEAQRKENKTSDFDFLKNLNYPELQVVPRASERLVLEVKEESDNWWRVNWTYIAPGLLTMGLGSVGKGYLSTDLIEGQSKDYAQLAQAGQLIGGIWVISGIWVSLMSPYRSAVQKINVTKKTDQRSELLRERLAEEALEKQASMVRSTRAIAVWSMVGINAAQYYYLNKDGRLFTTVATLVSFFPYFFEHRYIETYERHQDYKRRIYTPITSYIVVPTQKETVSLLSLNWSF